MRNKGFVVLLTLVLTVLSIYYLSFTFVSQNIQKEAYEWADDNNSTAQKYIDSVWTLPVYDLFGITEFTYKEVREKEINLGLDLKGGMHVTLEVSPYELVKKLAGRTRDTSFFGALEEAKRLSSTSDQKFTENFYDAFVKRRGKGKLWSVFSNAENKDEIKSSSTDEEVMAFVNKNVDEAINNAYEVIRKRIDRFGVSQPNIQKIQGTDRIQVELAGVKNQKRVRKLLQGIARLEFYRAVDMIDWQTQQGEIVTGELNDPFINLSELLKEEVDAGEDEGEFIPEDSTDIIPIDTSESDVENAIVDEEDSQEAEADSARAADKFSGLLKYFKGQWDYTGFYADLADTAKVNALFKRREIKELFPPNVKFFWDIKPFESKEQGVSYLKLYPLDVGRNGEPLLDGSSIDNAGYSIDLQNNSGYQVSISMDPKGARIWKRATTNNVGKRIAIVLDGYVVSAPNINEPIPNGQSVITGRFTLEEAKDLSNTLNAGKLPAKLTIVQEAVVGPALGQEAIEKGLKSVIAGLILVIIFMVLYYSIGGIVADLALLINIFFILGVLTQFGTSLTLPGIAGIVLTIGMSIDANVLIFERIREELKKGKGNLNAIKDGYNRAFWTIFDANVTTLLTAIILAFFGSGPIKGFAVTLMIGIVCSFFAAVFVTRVIIEWFAKKQGDKQVSFQTVLSKNLLSKFNWNIIGKRRIAYALSTIIIAGGIGVIAVNGLNLGVDFKGGRSYIVGFKEDVSASDIRNSLTASFDGKSPEVKTFNKANQLKVTTSYLIENESTETDSTVQAVLEQTLNKDFSGNFVEVLGSEKVGATIADDIKDASRTAVIFSLIAIFFYILIRFQKWQFGLGALVALFHDVLIVFSFYAFAGLFGIKYEVDQIFIAAMLTVIGYSINDTVVVFDRVKEYIHDNPSSAFDTILNNSINATFSRTFITSLTTLLVVVILLLFGGEVLSGFAYALLVGIIAGTYSSIFIATPLVLDLSKKENVKEQIADEVTKRKRMEDEAVRHQ